jgi:hypothetical protein
MTVSLEDKIEKCFQGLLTGTAGKLSDDTGTNVGGGVVGNGACQ